MQLIMYSKPGCHLCEGLQAKLEQIPGLVLEVRDITMREDWFQAYQSTIPVLCWRQGQREVTLPRLSPRASVQQVERMLQQYSPEDCSQ